jgi:hypothetical protein
MFFDFIWPFFGLVFQCGKVKLRWKRAIAERRQAITD